MRREAKGMNNSINRQVGRHQADKETRLILNTNPFLTSLRACTVKAKPASEVIIQKVRKD